MNRSRVLLNFMSMNWKELGPFGSLVISILYTAAFFTVPPVTKIVIEEAIENLRTTGYLTLRRCSASQMNDRTKAENTVKTLMKKNADYVNMMSEGNRDLILQSGYDVYTPEYSGNATVFTVVQSIYSGQVVAEWPADANNHGYIFRYSINEEALRNIYTEVNAGTTGCTVDGLIPGKEYIFTYCVVYSNNCSPYCDPIIMMVI